MKKIKKILVIIGFLSAFYLLYLLSSRDFYYINGVPITIYREKIILGKLYLGITTPSTDYIILDIFSCGEVFYFYNKTNFDLLTSSFPEMNLRDFSCMTMYHRGRGDISFDEFSKTHKIEDAYIYIDMYWDWGYFWPIIYYKSTNGNVNYIHHKGFFLWDLGTL